MEMKVVRDGYEQWGGKRAKEGLVEEKVESQGER